MMLDYLQSAFASTQLLIGLGLAIGLAFMVSMARSIPFVRIVSESAAFASIAVIMAFLIGAWAYAPVAKNEGKRIANLQESSRQSENMRKSSRFVLEQQRKAEIENRQKHSDLLDTLAKIDAEYTVPETRIIEKPVVVEVPKIQTVEKTRYVKVDQKCGNPFNTVLPTGIVRALN